MLKKTMMIFGFFTSAIIVLYWLSVFTGLFPVPELVPGYRFWFLSFPVADAWIAICAFLSSWFLLKNRIQSSLFGILAGSSLIFLGLYALLYGINTGLLFVPTPDELVEIIIKVYCLSYGPVSIYFHWKNLPKKSA